MQLPWISAYYSNVLRKMEKWMISARKNAKFTRKCYFSKKDSRKFMIFTIFHVKLWNSVKSTLQNLCSRQCFSNVISWFQPRQQKDHRICGFYGNLPKFQQIYQNITIFGEFWWIWGFPAPGARIAAITLLFHGILGWIHAKTAEFR